MAFKYLEHTSEAKFQADGRDMAEAFENAALAVFNIMVDTKKVKPVMRKKIKTQAGTKEELLFDFVDDLLFIMDSESFLLNKVEKMEYSEKGGKHTISCELLGDKAKNYETHGDVKAPTYDSMSIKEGKGKVTITMVVDV